MADIFSVEQLLEMEMEMEDPEALMVYESQLMSCINNVSIAASSSSAEGCPNLLSAGADPWGEQPNKYNSSSAGTSRLPQIIAFGFAGGTTSDDNDVIENYFEDRNDSSWINGLVAAPARRSPSYAQDHVLVERKRREKVAMRFLQLREIIPGLINTKMDKASILEEAAKYITQLKERVKLLEQQQMTEKSEEANSALCIEKTHGSSIFVSDDGSSSSCVNQAPLEIDAKMSENRDMVTIRIHSKLDYNLIPMILAEIGKLHLRLLNSNVMPFGKYAMDTTLVVQMEDEFCVTVEQLMEHMRVCLQQYLFQA